MSIIKSLIAAVALGAVFFVFSLAGADDMGGEVRKTCSACHSVKRVCVNLGVKNEAAWKLTLRNMKARGAKLASSRIDPMGAYLAGLEAGDPAVCD